MQTLENISLFKDISIKTMEKEIHIFDLDDTILETPTFGTFVGAENGETIDTTKYYPDYFEKVKVAFLDVLSKQILLVRMNDFVVPVQSETKKPFDSSVLQYFGDRKYHRMFEEFNGIIVLKSFPGFHSDPETLGKKVNSEIIESYNSAQNKMILTGRDINLAKLIDSRLEELGMSHPNYGVHTFKSGRLSIEQYKIATIMKSIIDFGWTCVHFYEDRKDWLLNAMKAVNETFPTVTFQPHLITNVKEKMKLT